MALTSRSFLPFHSWRVAQVLHPVAAVLLWLASIVSPSVVKAEMLTYSITGGLISGTLGGTPFTSANWTITAMADSSAAQFLPENSSTGGPIWASFWYQTVAPSISITSGSSVLTATLTGTGQWFLESRDYSAFLQTNASAVGFFYSPTAALEDGNGAYLDVVGFSNLQTTGTVGGTSGFDNGYPGIPGFSTSAGTLFIDVDTHAVGTFVTAVPEPSTSCMALTGIACGGFSMWRWRRRS